MRRFTDTFFTITAENAHFLTATDIHVTFAQEYHAVDISGDAIEVVDDTHLTVKITQTQSAQLNAGQMTELQVNYLDANGNRKASNTPAVDVGKNLLQKVLPS